MKWDEFCASVEDSLRENTRLLLIQCGPEWFPEHEWNGILRIEQIIARAQVERTQPCSIVRVLPYDLPRAASSPDLERFANWLTLASLTATFPGPVEVRVWWATQPPSPPDQVVVGDAIDARLESLEATLIAPDKPDWGGLMGVTGE